MSSWDVAKLTVRLGDHNIKSNNEVQHVEKRVKRVVRHRGFDSRTLVRFKSQHPHKFDNGIFLVQ